MSYKCQHCSLSFSSPAQVIHHKRHRECRARVCARCKTDFKTPARLHKHVENQQNLVCLHCQQSFCNRQLLQQHLRSIEQENESSLDRNRRIQPPTGFEQDDGFQQVLEENYHNIRDMETVSKNLITINRTVDPSFTYADLEQMIMDIYTSQKNAFKISIGFAYILYNTVTGEFRYFYNSSNNFLFKEATTISDRADVD